MSSDSDGGEAVEIRNSLVFQQGRTNPSYSIGCLPCVAEGELCAIICIAELGGRLIVAIPGSAWHKKVS